MKLLHHGIYLLIAAVLQVTWLSGISVFGVTPNIFPVLVMVIGFMCGRIQGIFTGLVYGLVFDILVGRFIGTNMLSFIIIGYASAVISDRFYSMPPFYVFMLMGAAAAAIYGMFYAVLCIAQYSASVIGIVRIILIECAYSSILAVPVAYLLKRTLALVRGGKF